MYQLNLKCSGADVLSAGGKEKGRLVLLNISLIILLLIMVVIILGIPFCIRYAVERETARFQEDLTRRHCEEVNQLYHQTRGWRHDFKNHLQTMLAYLEMGQTECLEGYLQELSEDYQQIDIALKTGNNMVDAILNSKISVIKAKNIKVDASASVPAQLPISDVDLSVMIGNLLDNALEACLKLPPEERFIRFYMTKAKANLYLYVMNSSDGTYRRGMGNYLTTKTLAGHGYGLQRIDKVIRKYNGYRSREDEGNVFATEILLPL